MWSIKEKGERLLLRANRPTSSAILHSAGGCGGGDVAVLHVLRAGEKVVERVGAPDAEKLDEAQELDLYCLV